MILDPLWKKTQIEYTNKQSQRTPAKDDTQNKRDCMQLKKTFEEFIILFDSIHR